jgi:hypothetical protein
MALMLAAAGAAMVSYFDVPEPERVEAPAADVESVSRLIEVELVEAPPKGTELCHRGYSSAGSTTQVEVAMVQEFVAFVCEGDPDCETIPPETAICIAEERFLGEGRAHGVTYVANPFAWVVSGDHQRVFVDARDGEAVAINVLADETATDMALALGR